MNTTTLIGLINNAALLLALGLLYDTIALKRQPEKPTVQALTGVILGAIGIAVMMTPWEFSPGVIFDTRSILLSVGGLFFGFIPTLVAVLVTGVYRLYLGGAGAWTGVAVIITSGAIGVGWKHLRRNRLQTISLLELYILGIVVHIAMLLWMLSLPWSVAIGVLSKISLPVMIVHPVGTVLLGKLMATRLQRKRAEEALRESEDRYRMLAENVTDIVWTTDMNLQFTYVSPSVLQLRGYTADEVMAQPLNHVLVPESLGKVTALLGQTIELIAAGNNEGWAPIVFESEQPCKDGTTVWTRNNAKIIPDSENRPAGIIGVSHNITEHKQAEEALRESEERFSLFMEHFPGSAYINNSEGTTVFGNKRVCEFYGFTREEYVGKTLKELAGQELAAQFLEQDHKVLSEGNPIEIEEIISDSSGPRHWITHKFPIYRQDQMTLIGGLSIEITERVRMEQHLRQQERLAAVGQLSAGIAHDFRNLLTTIILYAQISLRKHDLSPKLVHNLETIISESKKASDLVQQILDFSSRSMLRVQTLDLQSLTQGVMSLLRRMIPENIRLSLTGEQSAAFTVQADSGRIQQLLTNLVTNARDAMPHGGELRFALSHVEVTADDPPPVADMGFGTWVCLAVSDTGMGMTEKAHAHVFEPFFTTKEVGKGTGLGLAQVYGIVRQHEGYITVETELGQGTTFRIYLPAYADIDRASVADIDRASVADIDRASVADIDRASIADIDRASVTDIDRASVKETEIEEPPAPPRGQGETILLAEDDKNLREAGQSILESLGYRVFTAMNGREALAIYEAKGGVDLVVTDIVMPEMGGKELVRELARLTPNLKALGITGYAVKGIAEELKEAGFLGVIYKPFAVEKLAWVIRHALDEAGYQKPRWRVE